MRSPKAPGNLRDFHIDERTPFSGASLGDTPTPTTQKISAPPPPPRQSLRTRQPEPEEEWTPANAVSGSGISETNSLDSLWSTWEQDAGGVDLSQAVASPVAREAAPRETLPTYSPSPTSKFTSASSTSMAARAPSTTPTFAQQASRAVASRLPTSTSVPVDATPADAASNEGQARTEAFSAHLPWAADLAHNERRMERTGTVDYTNQFQKQEVLRARTREFTALLQKQFREQVEVFNDARHSPAHQIHVYKVSKSEEDFMLYRNGVKLVVSGSRAGRVIFAFNQYLGQIYAPTQSPVLEIEAAWGPFDQLFWSYKGERVQIMDLVRYFITEFVRQSFR